MRVRESKKERSVRENEVFFQLDVAIKNTYKADNLALFRSIAGNLHIIAANFHNQQMESKVNLKLITTATTTTIIILNFLLQITDEWRLMSLVIDRLFLIIHLTVNMMVNVWFIYNSPTLFDNRPVLEQAAPFKPLSGNIVID